MHEEDEVWLPEFELLHASNGEEALSIIQAGKESNCPIAVAYIDIRMPPGIDGIETIRRIRKIDRDVEIVIMTAYTDKALPEIVHDMELLHKLLYIRKPFAHEEIQQITLSLVEKWNIERELAEKRRQLTNGHRRLEAVLNATGDAIAMHDSDGHLVFANQVYEELLGLKESELKKIPPRALTARFGERFREPDLRDVEGRFLLDSGNVVETTSDGQGPQQRLFYRSTAPVRDGHGEMIGSLVLYRDVSKEIEAEQMRAEVLRLRTELETTGSFADLVGTGPGMRQVYALLFYRIAAFPIEIPPLRERREDIPLLARHFLDKHAERADKSISGTSTAALRLLIQYDWPGNVRELENAIERAVLLETDVVLQAGSLPPQLSPVIAVGSDGSPPTAILPLAEVERQALVHALEVADNNITQAAQALGINRATLHRKLKKYDLSKD